jgi:hypothetical protein
MEDVIYLQVAQLEAALSTELKEKSSLLETQNEMHQKMPEPQLSSDTENALRIQVVFHCEELSSPNCSFLLHMQ